MRILIIDNYDSFTYNLYQYIGELMSERYGSTEFDINVKRNDEITLDDIRHYQPDRIIISPGPGNPSIKHYFGICAEVITQLGPKIPLLGVCLGMQGIAHCFGGDIIAAEQPMHGKTSLIKHDQLGVYQGIPQFLEIMRYHSLIVDSNSLPDCFTVTSVICDDQASTDNIAMLLSNGAEIMGIRHKEYPIEGIQYHPESFATEGGKKLLANFLLV